jgi:flagellar hook-associated protein 3
MMRVTQSMVTNNVLQHISDGYGKISDLQNQLSSGKKITKPSQDPVVATMGISYRTTVNHVDQYEKNVTTATKWTSTTDDALSKVDSVLQRVRELTNEASTDTYTSQQRQAAGLEISQLQQELVTIGNTQAGGQYVFSGSDTAHPLLTQDTATGVVTANQTAVANPNLSVEVNDGIQVQINVDPGKVFTTTAQGANSLFGDLNGLAAALNSGTATASQISPYLSKIDAHLTEVSNAQADLGARENRITMISNRLESQKSIATDIMSKNEDADYPATIIQLNQQQNVYTAALSVGAKIIQTSLVDYLK